MKQLPPQLRGLSHEELRRTYMPRSKPLKVQSQRLADKIERGLSVDSCCWIRNCSKSLWADERFFKHAWTKLWCWLLCASEKAAVPALWFTVACSATASSAVSATSWCHLVLHSFSSNWFCRYQPVTRSVTGASWDAACCQGTCTSAVQKVIVTPQHLKEFSLLYST